VHPALVSASKVLQLSQQLKILDLTIPSKEATRLSRDIFQTTAHLSEEFKLTSPPWFHNFLVNMGLRQKGLCFHWSDALYVHLLHQEYPHFEFHVAGANIGEYFFEHNALVVVAKGAKIEDGILIDPWRNSGRLYFSKVSEDTQYRWKHRANRGCLRYSNVTCLP